MRSPEQIANLRKALFVIFGPYASIMPDEDVDTFANRLESGINNRKFVWVIKCKTNSNADIDWHKIKAEPTKPYCTISEMCKKCEELMQKYPKIVSLYAIDINEPNEENALVFERE